MYVCNKLVTWNERQLTTSGSWGQQVSTRGEILQKSSFTHKLIRIRSMHCLFPFDPTHLRTLHICSKWLLILHFTINFNLINNSP